MIGARGACFTLSSRMYVSFGILDGDGIFENLLACSTLAERGEFVSLSFRFSYNVEHVRNELSKTSETLFSIIFIKH
mgnify:CR=1 FL=1